MTTSNTLKVMDDLRPDIGLQAKQRSAVAQKLAAFLASTYLLYLKTLYYHWNVTGANFHSLHEMFQKQYENLHKAGDEIAERIRALGHMAPGTTREFTALSVIEEDAALPKNSRIMVEHLLRDNEKASLAARIVFQQAQEVGDEVTADMMIGRMAYHDEVSWMLRANIE
jgi:starvation-inducible DNA-binding protein